MGIGIIIIAITITKAENDCQEKNIFTLSCILNLHFFSDRNKKRGLKRSFSGSSANFSLEDPALSIPPHRSLEKQKVHSSYRTPEKGVSACLRLSASIQSNISDSPIDYRQRNPFTASYTSRELSTGMSPYFSPWKL